MRAISLVLALIFLGPAAVAAEPTFIDRLTALGPQDLRVSEGLGSALPEAQARVFVEQGLIVIEIRRAKDAPPEVFRYDGKGFDRAEVWSQTGGGPDLLPRCNNGGGSPERYEIQCWSLSDLSSRALRPPHRVWTLSLSADGLRVVQEGFGERLTLTPLHPTPRGDPSLAPGLPASLGDALAQLAAHQKGYLSGGSSGGGDWYGSDLWLRQARGLDFRLERTVWPDRGGRSDQVPATWSFDYRGTEPKDATVLTWRMVRTRKGAVEADFWCVGRPVSVRVEIACHKGGGPSDVRGKPDVAFRLEPFPEWRIYVEDGPDNPFDSVGSTRLEPQPFP